MPSPSFSDPAIDAFVSDLIEQAQRHGVALKLPSTPSLLYPGAAESHVSGYFVAHPTPTLAVATGKPAQEWLEILAHESSHMDQWTDNDPSWLGNTMADGREAVDWLDSWSAGALELTDEQLADVVARAKAVEMDCERRTLLKISKWGLPIDSSAYAQRANAYVHFYDVVAVALAVGLKAMLLRAGHHGPAGHKPIRHGHPSLTRLDGRPDHPCRR